MVTLLTLRNQMTVSRFRLNVQLSQTFSTHTHISHGLYEISFLYLNLSLEIRWQTISRFQLNVQLSQTFSTLTFMTWMIGKTISVAQLKLRNQKIYRISISVESPIISNLLNSKSSRRDDRKDHFDYSS